MGRDPRAAFRERLDECFDDLVSPSKIGSLARKTYPLKSKMGGRKMYHLLSMAEEIAGHNDDLAYDFLSQAPAIYSSIGYKGLIEAAEFTKSVSEDYRVSAVKSLKNQKGFVNKLLKAGGKGLAIDVYEILADVAAEDSCAALRMFISLPAILQKGGGRRFVELLWDTIEANYVMGEALLEKGPAIMRLLGQRGFESVTRLALAANEGDDYGGDVINEAPKNIEKMLRHVDKDSMIAFYDECAEVDSDAIYSLVKEGPWLAEHAGYDAMMAVADCVKSVADANDYLANDVVSTCRGTVKRMMKKGGRENVVAFYKMLPEVADVNPDMAGSLLDEGADIYGALGKEGVSMFVEKAKELMKKDEERAEAFMKGQSAEYHSFVDQITPGLKLKDVKPVISNYLAALLGYRADIEESKNGRAAFTDGKKVYLPGAVSDFKDGERNFLVYKIAATREEGHIEYGSYDFELKEVKELVKTVKKVYGKKEKERGKGKRP